MESFANGSVSITGDAVVDFAGGGAITSVFYGGALTLDGAKAFLASGSAKGSNSALRGLRQVNGAVTLLDGASLTTNGDLTIGNGNHFSYVNLSASGAGGGRLAIGGALKIASLGSLSIGDNSITSATAANAKAIDFTGVTQASLNVAGGVAARGGTAKTTVNFASAAGFGQKGVLANGSVSITGDAVVDFSGGGEIASIRYGGALTLDGATAYLASGSAEASNSALSGLTLMAGDLTLLDGAAVTTNAALTIGDGTHGTSVHLANGAALHVKGKLSLGAYANFFVGQTSDAAASSLSLYGLAKTPGTINVSGSASVRGRLTDYGGAVNASQISSTAA